jgi:hypothetical protein
MRYLHGIMTISLILTVGTSVSENAPSLDVKDIPQLKQAVQAAMRNLMSYFTPNDVRIKCAPFLSSGCQGF